MFDLKVVNIARNGLLWLIILNKKRKLKLVCLSMKSYLICILRVGMFAI